MSFQRSSPTFLARRLWARLVVVLAIWTAATALVLAFAAESSVGPVVLTLSRRHGVHLGDLVALAVAYAAALLITVVVVRQRWPRSRAYEPSGRQGTSP